MTQRPPASKHQQREYADRMAGDFEATLLHNKVHDDLLEDAHLACILDAAARAAEALEFREHDVADVPADYCEKLDNAHGEIAWVGRQRALEAVAVSCAEVIEDCDDWTDVWTQSDLDAAREEAREWLQRHTNEAARAGVLEAV